MLATDLKGLRAQAASESERLLSGRERLEAAQASTAEALAALEAAGRRAEAAAVEAARSVEAELGCVERLLGREERDREAALALEAVAAEEAAAREVAREAAVLERREEEAAREAALAERAVDESLRRCRDMDRDAAALLAKNGPLARLITPPPLPEEEEGRRRSLKKRRRHTTRLLRAAALAAGRRAALRHLRAWRVVTFSAARGRAWAGQELRRLCQAALYAWRRCAVAAALARLAARRLGLARGLRRLRDAAKRRGGAALCRRRAEAHWARRRVRRVLRRVLRAWCGAAREAGLERLAVRWHRGRMEAWRRVAGRKLLALMPLGGEECNAAKARAPPLAARLLDGFRGRREARLLRAVLRGWRAATVERRGALSWALRGLRLRATASAAARAAQRRGREAWARGQKRRALAALWRRAARAASARGLEKRLLARRGLLHLRAGAAALQSRRLRRLGLRRAADARFRARLQARVLAAWAFTAARLAGGLATARHRAAVLDAERARAAVGTCLAFAERAEVSRRLCAADLSAARYRADLAEQQRRLDAAARDKAACLERLARVEAEEARLDSARAALNAVERCCAAEHDRLQAEAHAAVAARAAETRQLEKLCADLDERTTAAQAQRSEAQARLRASARRDARSLKAALAAAKALADLLRQAEAEEHSLTEERRSLAAKLESLAARLGAVRKAAADIAKQEREHIAREYARTADLQLRLAAIKRRSEASVKKIANSRPAAGEDHAGLTRDLLMALEAKRDRLRAAARDFVPSVDADSASDACSTTALTVAAPSTLAAAASRRPSASASASRRGK